MMLYQKIFAEYGLNCGQLLLTKHTMRYEKDRFNAKIRLKNCLISASFRS
ncbi:hypothetical protein [Allobaculum sp. Allo2]|nr:hypothetical protein [Allobaculum sp. Allo2]